MIAQLANTVAASVAANAQPWWQTPGLLPVVGTLLGVLIGGGVSIVTSDRSAKSLERLQQARFDREARAARLSTIAALRDLAQYAEAAADAAHFSPALWEPAVRSLAARVAAPETVYGFADNEWTAVTNADSEARLAFTRLKAYRRWHPFENHLDRTNAEVEATQMRFVLNVCDIGTKLHEKLRLALSPLGFELPPLTHPAADTILNFLRMPYGQELVAVTRQQPDAPYKH